MKYSSIVLTPLLLAGLILNACGGGGGGGGGSGGSGGGGGIGTPEFTVTYDGNHSDVDSDTVPVDNTLYAELQEVTVLGHGQMARPDYGFVAWNTASDGSGTTRNPGSTFIIGGADVVLYARWSSTVANVDILVGEVTGSVDVAAGDDSEPTGILVGDDSQDVEIVVGDGYGEAEIVVGDGSEDVAVGVGDGSEDVDIVVGDGGGDVEFEVDQ